MRNQSPGTALRFYRARTPISTRYSSSKPPPLPKAFHVKHPVSYPPVSMIPANARQPVDYAAGGRTHAASSSLRVDGVAGGPEASAQKNIADGASAAHGFNFTLPALPPGFDYFGSRVELLTPERT